MGILCTMQNVVQISSSVQVESVSQTCRYVMGMTTVEIWLMNRTVEEHPPHHQVEAYSCFKRVFSLAASLACITVQRAVKVTMKTYGEQISDQNAETPMLCLSLYVPV